MKKKVEIIKTGANKIAVGIFLLFISTLYCPKQLFASEFTEVQQQDQKKVTLNVKDRTLVNILSEIKRQTGLAYGFRDNRDATSNERFSIQVKEVSVDSALTVLLKGSKYSHQIVGDLILISTKKDKTAEEQKDLIMVKGTVVDENGNPIPGATILVHGTSRGIASDMEGRYSIEAKPDDVLKITFVGYKDEIIPIRGKTKIDVRLNPKAENIEEVAVVAFGTQKKESVVSAITTVDARTLKSSNSDLTSQFAGKIAGIIGWQQGGIPGALTEEEMNTKFYIRGITSFQKGANLDPLILLDGVEASKLDLARIDPEDIETFSVMKDASATAMYGARGANGVIIVTTKKGEEGAVYTSVRYEAIATMPTSEIDVVDPITWMEMYNQALISRDPTAMPKYSAERIARTGSKKYPSWVYPANDWYKTLFKNFAVNHHMGINIRGGSKVIQYYASINHNRDEGMLKTDRLNQFDVNIKNNNTTFRVNLNIDLSKGIKLVVNSYSTIDSYHGPLKDVTEAYSLAFYANPVDFAPTYPADDTYNWPHLRFGKSSSGTNPYAEIQAGYKDRTRFSTMNRLEYIQNLAPLLKGLEFRGDISFSQTGYYSNPYSTSPFYYRLLDYNHVTGKHTLEALNPLEGNRTLSKGSGSVSGSNQLSYNIKLLHTGAWKDHTTSYIAVLSGQETTKSSPMSVLDGIRQRNLGLSMRLSYGYKERYYIEGSFGYNGSERFAKKHRMGFFPSVGGAWVASKEPFMMGAANWLSFLKLRLSYGKVGNDGIINDPRFVHLPSISQGKDVVSFRPGENTIKPYVISGYPNEDITWEIAEQVNFGLEATFFNGLFETTVDIYQQIRHNVLDKRTVVPEAMGLGIQPLDNIGKVKSQGLDFSGKIQHAFSPDLWVILNGTLTYNKAVFEEIEEAADKPYYQWRKGHDISQAVGYIAEGLFRDEQEIANSPVQGGDLMPGDIRYRDVNDDGVVDVEDAVHIGFPTTPRLIYGFNGFVNYKGLEFSFAFQGSGQRGFFINPAAMSPFANNHALLTAIYKDHWSTDNMSERPLWPRLSTKNIIEHNPQEDASSDKETRMSTYFLRECRFLRCTSLELAYNLPKQWSRKLALKNLKVFVRANNPFIISNFDLWDVELGNNGFNYPIQKTYSVGLNVNF
ncbi:MAG: SusC/RagA family TonB-linked outer membrane protein [Butyricimonas synergistica]|nr:MAG: SusC/RagA family TonB-linked outer membrane protein [Butyricimonas synergistica]